MAEQLIRNEQVVSSILTISSKAQNRSISTVLGFFILLFLIPCNRRTGKVKFF